MAERISPEGLLNELAAPVEALIHRHYENTHPWYPHETTPWSLARNFTEADPWYPEEYPLSDGVRSSIYVNLLTEDNLPYYTETILRQAPKDHPLNEWTRRWTAEEGRHSMAIRDWALATRALNPVLLEDGRMSQMSGGVVPEPTDMVDMLAYTSFQELATQVAHRNTGRKLDKERNGKEVMAKVAGDETLHHAFYRDAAKVALEIDPDTTILAIARNLRHFAMPGIGIPNFRKHALAINREGIYGKTEFLKSVVRPTLAAWALNGIADVDIKTDKAKAAREEIDAIKISLEADSEREIAWRQKKRDKGAHNQQPS